MRKRRGIDLTPRSGVRGAGGKAQDCCDETDHNASKHDVSPLVVISFR
jgi:hypothetical protein